MATFGGGGCGAPVRAGDWMCSGCGNHNFASRQSCNKCAAPKPSGGGGYGGFVLQPAAGGTGHYSADNMRPGDWMCPGCGNHNFASRQSCNKCSAPREGEYGAPAAPISMEGMRPGDWMCPGCGNHNFASRQSCNKCGSPKEEGSSGFIQAKGGAAGMRPGDWMCPSCNNHNFASRQECNKCGTPREDGGGGGGGGGYGAAAKDRKPNASPYGKSGPSPGAYVGDADGDTDGPPQLKEGDWVCPDCNNHNYASRVNCNRCGTLREGMKEGDWVCRGCKTHNFASKMNCFKCQAPRAFDKGCMKGGGMCGMMMYQGGKGGFGGGFGMPGKGGKGPATTAPPMGLPGMNAMKDGDWMCPACGNHNYASRVNCNRCSAIRPGMKTGDWVCRSCKNHNFVSRETCNKCDAPKADDQ